MGGKAGVLKKNDVTIYPIQGIAFHCLLWSLTQLVRYIEAPGMRSRVVGQIHDSLLADCPEDEVQEILSVAHRIMTVDLPRHWSWICVPLETESEVTPVDGSWSQKSQWVCDGGVWAPRKKAA